MTDFKPGDRVMERLEIDQCPGLDVAIPGRVMSINADGKAHCEFWIDTYWMGRTRVVSDVEPEKLTKLTCIVCGTEGQHDSP